MQQKYAFRPEYSAEVPMKQLSLYEDLKGNSYPGRGIVLGRSGDGLSAVIAYFIMGRSENSRNRIFLKDGDGIRTQAFDPEKMKDPSLIIYAPVRVLDNTTIVTNGDQTDTIFEGLKRGIRFEDALKSREFEPDAPNYTPRISGIVRRNGHSFDYQLSILKSDLGDPAQCLRFTFSYASPKAGEGHFIHTYRRDGNPLPSFAGEPKTVVLSDDLNTFTEKLWESLNPDNKVSLFTRFINLETGETDSRIRNRNE